MRKLSQTLKIIGFAMEVLNSLLKPDIFIANVKKLQLLLHVYTYSHEEF